MRCVWIGGIHRGVGGNLPRASPLNPGNPAEREGVVAALERISCVTRLSRSDPRSRLVLPLLHFMRILSHCFFDSLPSPLSPLQHRCVPVFLDPIQERNSEKFSRTSLWPALHNVLPVFGKKSTSWYDREVPEALWRGELIVLFTVTLLCANPAH